MEQNADVAELLALLECGHAGTIYTVNQAVVVELYERLHLTQAECQKRAVRFLPAQVMRPIFQAAGMAM
jgi:hypothetical protein